MPCPYTLDGGGQLLGQGIPTKGHILKENQLSLPQKPPTVHSSLAGAQTITVTIPLNVEGLL